jgi:tripartite-type tricarboxylate transporter receptor subunit TctC
MFKNSQGLDIVAVSFGGSAPAIQSALAGHTPIAFTVITPAVPQVKEGKLRALAVTTSKRSSALPDVPTLSEAGLAHQESDTILGVLVPAQTPQPIVALLHREIRNAMNEPDVAEKLASLGLAECQDLITQHAIDVETARNVVVKAMLGDQPLPLKDDSRQVEFSRSDVAPS